VASVIVAFKLDILANQTCEGQYPDTDKSFTVIAEVLSVI